MKWRLFWIAWAIAPLGIVALHLGPGQALLARDRAAEHVRTALAAEQAKDWAKAAENYAAARVLFPEDRRSERAKLQLHEAKARVYAGQLVEGADQLATLISDEDETGHADAALIREARHALGEAGYFTAWLMRLEGAAPDEWKPESENARQQYRLLAEDAEAAGDAADAETFKKNVEAVIRLEQMDRSELKALPLPKKCNGNCKGLCQRKREQRLSKCQKPGTPKEDVRKQIKTESAGAAKEREKGS